MSPNGRSASPPVHVSRTYSRVAPSAWASGCTVLILLGLNACGGAAGGGARGVAPPVRAVTNADTQAVTHTTVKQWSAPRNIVARVGRHSITKAAVAHWIAVEAILTREYRGDRPVPSGVVPDPPRYRRCIAYLAQLDGVKRATLAAAATQLRRRCGQLRTTLRLQAIRLLILHYWVTEEATRQGVSATSQEIREATARIFQVELRQGFLAAAGVRRFDERLVVADHLLLEKLQQRLPIFKVVRQAARRETKQTVVQVELAEQKLNEEMATRWTPKTHCRMGYVVPDCNESHTPGGR